MHDNPTKKFNYFLKGTSDKAVLFIHGITGTPSEMRYQAKALNKAEFNVMCNALPRHCSTLGELKKATWNEIADACEHDLLTLNNDYRKVFVGGISMGAVMSVHLAFKHPHRVSGIIALAPTLFYDGRALHKGQVLMDLVWHIPVIRNMIDIRESWPYGLKDEELRSQIERFYRGAIAKKFDNKALLFGSPFFPLSCLYQHHILAKRVKKELPQVKNPILILHAKEYDRTRSKNARYLYDHIGSADKNLIELENSYHMVTIDLDKDRVAQEMIAFLNNH
ncbi:MAG: alpha/beta fold hydrolase [Candidatus Omnitrophica bacterium]|nr:alpha/beta fold hydrolase [Candidatus Omnitrophota bacterium]